MDLFFVHFKALDTSTSFSHHWLFRFMQTSMVLIELSDHWGIILHEFTVQFWVMPLHLVKCYVLICLFLCFIFIFFFEFQCRKQKDLFLWMAKCPNGPSVKFLVSAGNNILWFWLQRCFCTNLLIMIKVEFSVFLNLYLKCSHSSHKSMIGCLISLS